jgi:RNA polymerase sigma-70 factor, ECF subfamily
LRSRPCSVDPREHASGFITQHAHQSVTKRPEAGWDWPALRKLALREAQRILRDQRAHDAAQEAVLRAWRHAERCQTPQQPQPWVRAIARREALRIAGRERETLVLEGPVRDELLEGADLRVDIARALRDLSRDERRLLHDRYWRDLSERQIAAEQSMPIGTAKTQLHRARAKLRLALATPDAASANA